MVYQQDSIFKDSVFNDHVFMSALLYDIPTESGKQREIGLVVWKGIKGKEK